MEMLDVLRGAVANTQRLIDGTTPDQLGNTTPCTDYDVRSLLNHIIGGMHLFAMGAEGGSPDMSEAPDFTADASGSAKQAAERLLTAYEAPGVLEREHDLSFMKVPGERAMAVAVLEAVVHSWDLARATGQDHGVDDQLAELLLAGARHGIPAEFRGPGQAFGPEVPIADDAPGLDRLVAFLGRQP